MGWPCPSEKNLDDPIGYVAAGANRESRNLDEAAAVLGAALSVCPSASSSRRRPRWDVPPFPFPVGLAPKAGD
jgi:hypothetical protein